MSTQPLPQDQDVKTLIQRVLEGHIKSSVDIGKMFLEVNNRINGYHELDGKITSLAFHVKIIDLQLAQATSSSKNPIGIFPGKPESNPKSFCSVAPYVHEPKKTKRDTSPLDEVGNGQPKTQSSF